MRPILRTIHWKRFLLTWFLFFLVVFATSFLLLQLFVLFEQPWTIFVSIILPPLLYLLFAWIYFRGVPHHGWPHRIIVMISWMVLTIALTAALMPVVYGYSPLEVFSLGALQGYVINGAAIIVAGFIAHQNRPAASSMPSARSASASPPSSAPRPPVQE